MGLFVSLILIAIGAIMAWAVNTTSSGAVDVNTVGYILLVIGLVGLIIDLLMFESWGPRVARRRTAYVEGAEPAYPARRRTVVEEDEVF